MATTQQKIAEQLEKMLNRTDIVFQFLLPEHLIVGPTYEADIVGLLALAVSSSLEEATALCDNSSLSNLAEKIGITESELSSLQMAAGLYCNSYSDLPEFIKYLSNNNAI